MAVIIHKIIKWYSIFNEDWADPRYNDRFMISSPWPILSLLGFYMYFVLNLGPRFMAKRQPFKLDRILQLYNLLQILINAYLFYKILDLAWLRDYSFSCEPVDYSYTPRVMEIVELVWKYFLLKIIDLLDTVFFILRKKQSHVTFLHLYHHTGTILVGWTGIKYLPGGQSTFLGMLNTFVHVIMYTYYLLTSMKINTNLWKKYLTQLQIMQFFFITLHLVQLLWVKDCGYPLWPIFALVPQNFFMMILFGEFYYKTYIKKKTEIKTMPIKTIETKEFFTEVSNKKPKVL